MKDLTTEEVRAVLESVFAGEEILHSGEFNADYRSPELQSALEKMADSLPLD